jgi:hypothetical protein
MTSPPRVCVYFSAKTKISAKHGLSVWMTLEDGNNSPVLALVQFFFRPSGRRQVSNADSIGKSRGFPEILMLSTYGRRDMHYFRVSF